MRSAAEIVEAFVHELLPSIDDGISLDDIERRRREFDAVALQADRRSMQRAIALACSDQLDKLHGNLRLRAWVL